MVDRGFARILAARLKHPPSRPMAMYQGFSRAMSTRRAFGAVVTSPKVIDVNKVVVLFGWMGASDGMLRKYSLLYEERGCTTIRFLPPASACLIFHERLKTGIDELLDIVSEIMQKSKHDTRVYVHVFSNSGATSWCATLQRMHHPDSPYDPVRGAIKGIIFDSSPEKLTAVPSLYQAIVVAIKGRSRNPLLTIAAHAASGVTLTGMFGVFVLAAPIFGVSPIFGEFWSTLAHNELRCPQTMIFSTTDPLINFRNVEEMAAAREALGVRVTRVRLERGGHVQHLLTNPELYAKTLTAVVHSTDSQTRIHSTGS